jgi:hypothetical protein
MRFLNFSYKLSIVALFTIMLPITMGCNNASKKSDSAKVLSLTSKYDDEEDISDINLFSGFDLISLQDDSVIIGEIDKILCTDSLIYLVDKYQGHCINIFSSSGKYLNTINRFGRGPGEYTQLSDIFVNEKESTFNILDCGCSRLLVYDLLGNQYLRSLPLPKSFKLLKPMKNGYIGFMGNYSEDPNIPNNIWILNKNLEVRNSYFSIVPERESHTIDNKYISKYHDEIQIVMELSNDVYSYSGSQMNKKYTFDFGKMNLPKVDKSELDNSFFLINLSMNYIYDISRFQETDSFILASATFQGRNVMIVYEKNTNTMEIVQTNYYNDDKYHFFFGYVKDMDEKNIYSIISARSMADLIRGHNDYIDFEGKYPEQIKNLRVLFQKKPFDPEGNPVLAIYHLR